MSRKLASIQKIINILPIPGADAIEVAQVLGWECVIKKSEGFKIEDLCVYIEIDSIVPDRSEFEFLRYRKFRIKTIKLRGQVSQGLLLPLSILPKGNYNEGDDVSDILGVKKHDPQEILENELFEIKVIKPLRKIHKALYRYSWYRKLFYKPKKDTFPKFITKTNEDRIQLFSNICEREKDTDFILTEKLDGSSLTAFLIKNKKRFLCFGKKYIFGVCSRNLHLKTPDNSSYWAIAKQHNIESVLKKLIRNEDFIVLQGEVLGDKIQGNKYKISGYDFYAFNLKYPSKNVNSIEAATILKDYDIKFVPILETEFKLRETIKECVEYAKGKSTLLPTLREGVVLRNYDKNISFKIINPDFLLKNDD